MKNTELSQKDLSLIWAIWHGKFDRKLKSHYNQARKTFDKLESLSDKASLQMIEDLKDV